MFFMIGLRTKLTVRNNLTVEGNQKAKEKAE